MRPLGFEAGLARLLEEAAPNHIGIVRVASTTNSMTIMKFQTLLTERVPIDHTRITEYRPPSTWAGTKESTLQAMNPDLHYVIIDSIVYTGRTLGVTSERLSAAGLGRDKMWYLGYFQEAAGGVRLDKLDTVLEQAALESQQVA